MISRTSLGRVLINRNNGVGAVLYQNSKTLTHATCCRHWDIHCKNVRWSNEIWAQRSSADVGEDESSFPQFGISRSDPQLRTCSSPPKICSSGPSVVLWKIATPYRIADGRGGP